MSNNINNKISSFIKGSSILVISNVCLKAINFFLLPLYTHNLTPEMIGVSDSITTLTGVILPLLTMGLDSAYSAFYFDKEDPNRSLKVFHTLTWVFLAIGFTPLFLMLFSRPLSNLLFHTYEYSYIVTLALASVTFSLWSLSYSLELRLENRMFLFGLSNIISSVSMILLNILFVSVLKYGASSLVLSTTIVHAESVLIYLIMVRKLPKKEYFDCTLLRHMMKFAIPLIPMTVMIWILTLSDRYVLLHYHGSDAVGFYGIALRFTNLLNVVISAVSMAYTTFAFSSKDDENAKRVYYYIYNIESVLLLAVSFSIGLFGKEIIQIMTAEAYSSSFEPLRDLMFAQSIYAMTTVVGYGIYFEKKSVYSFIAVTAGAVLNLGLNFLLIPQYGIRAAALTTLLGYLLNYLITLYFSKKVYPCHYGEIRVGITTVLLYAACMVGEKVGLIYKSAIWLLCIIGTAIAFKDVIGHVAGVAMLRLGKGTKT